MNLLKSVTLWDAKNSNGYTAFAVQSSARQALRVAGI
jgi:hypothetical protein